MGCSAGGGGEGERGGAGGGGEGEGGRGGGGGGCSQPKRPIAAAEQAKFKYYNEDIHVASFKLPQFAKIKLGM